VISADAPGGDHDGLGADVELPDLLPRAGPSPVHAARCQHGAPDAVHDAAGGGQGVDAVPEPELHEPLCDGFAHPPLERFDEAGSGTPGDVEPRDRVAVPLRAAVTALGPSDDREQPVTHVVQPGTLLAGGEVDVRPGPLTRPVVLGTVELRAAHPVLHRQVDGVPDAHASLLGTVHQEQPTERPERLATEALLGLLLEQHHPPARVGELCGGDEPGEPTSDDDRVSFHAEQSGP
jgi:hypothetical protein